MSGRAKAYTCAECGEVFESSSTDEEVDAEREALWGEIPAEEMAVVCDGCFLKVLRRSTA